MSIPAKGSADASNVVFQNCVNVVGVGLRNTDYHSARMKFVALLSGGKDSCYNVIKCQQYGHELVCLANLCPPASFNGEEMNSFMYQSAAHAIIPLMEECFGVPLLRREILGSAVRQELDYEVSKEDEVEDLFNLLVDVKTRFPDVMGVSCGAIVSTYQRFRVESVCSRLGMTPLTYLWQRDRADLLNEMVDSGLEAVLVKVAGAGLEPYKHLGKTLGELRSTLFRLNTRFGLDVCGEGGEFESLVLDCSVFKKKIVLDDCEVVLDDEDCMVGNLKIISAHTVDKVPSSTAQVPDLCQALLETVHHLNDSCSEQSQAVIVEQQSYVTLPTIALASSGLGQTAVITAAPSVVPLTPQIVQLQLQQVFARLRSALLRVGVRLADILFVHLYIADISLFGPVNEEYCKWFGKYPPSRSCIAVPLSVGVGVALDAVFLKDSHAAVCQGLGNVRQVLHVQSVSEWAPLCIGPYSQANTILDSLIFTAGQIPLNPSTMTVLSSTSSESQCDLLYAQLALSCRHVHRVLQTLNSSLHRVLCCTVFLNIPALGKEALSWSDWSKVQSTVQKLIENNFVAKPASGDEDGEESDVQSVDSANVEPDRRVPILLIGVPGLPRDALVEVEMVSFRDNAIPASLLVYGEKRGAATVCERVEFATTAERVQNWPFWRCNNSLITTSESNTSSDKVSYTVESKVINFQRNLCTGFVEVSTVGVSSGGSEFVELDLEDIVQYLVQGVADLSAGCDLALNHALLTLRVYHTSAINGAELTSLVSKQLAVLCGVTKRFPVLAIPVTSLKPGSVLAAQVIAVDAHQLQSELWIHSK